MSSSFVFYKFKSQREPSRIAFDGTAISVFDLKKEIIAENKMGKGADFDFAIYHADTEEGAFSVVSILPAFSSAPLQVPRAPWTRLYCTLSTAIGHLHPAQSTRRVAAVSRVASSPSSNWPCLGEHLY